MKTKLLLLTLVVSYAACKHDPRSNPTTAPPVVQDNTTKEEAVPSVKVAFAKIDNDFLNRVRDQKPAPMITDSIWHHYVGISIRIKDPLIYKGDWIDLLPGGDYKSGKYSRTLDQGKFVFDELSQKLELRSSQQDSSSEWRVKVDPDAMLLIGTEKYQNNPWQIKLVRKYAIPSESSGN